MSCQREIGLPGTTHENRFYVPVREKGLNENE